MQVAGRFEVMLGLDEVLEIAENMTYEEFCEIKQKKGITKETYNRPYNNDFEINFPTED